MRKIKDNQLPIGHQEISKFRFDYKSRDDIPPLLRGLQYIYMTPAIRQQVFAELEKMIPETVDKNNGRPGMHLWKIFVFGVLRLNLNWDYDRLQEMANNHMTIRQMLGHGQFDGAKYNLQTLKDNVSLLTPEILERINGMVVETGHKLVKKKSRR